MEPGTEDIVVTTVERLVATVGISADCRIECHASDGDKDVKSKLCFGTRIVGVDGHMVTDSGELRELLHSRRGNTVLIAFERVDCYGERVELRGSVECNGVSSSVAPQNLTETQRNRVANGKRQSDVEKPSSLVSSASSSPAESVSAAISFPSVAKRCSDEVEVGHDEGGSQLAFSFSNFSLPELSGKVNQIPGKEAGSITEGLTPSLLEFEQLKVLGRGSDMNSANGVTSSSHRPASSSRTIRRSLAAALDGVEIGSCIICVYQDVNPIAELEFTAAKMGASVLTVDLGAKLRRRTRPEEFGEQFVSAMTEGKWFVMVNAHKSISTCGVLEDLMREARARNFEGFNPKARVIICLEPHPHFPRFLINHARVVKVRSSLSTSLTVLSHTMTASMTRDRVVTGGSFCTIGETSENRDDPGRQGRGKRRVRINAAVDVVEIAPREVIETQLVREEHLSDGRLALCATFSGVPGDRFLCVDVAGEDGRFAVGSSMGNVYFVDRFGKSLLQTHVHDSSIWDLSSHDKFHFATACEDGTCVEWAFDLDCGEDVVLTPSYTASLGNDAYCLSYVKSLGSQYPFLLLGGLRHELLLLRGGGNTSMRISIPANAQVVDAFGNEPVALVGGSDGTVMAVNVDVGLSVVQFAAHTRKLPALTVRNSNNFFTGSFDSTILSWDYRTPKPVAGIAPNSTSTADITHTLKLRGYVTGLHVNDMYMAGSVGENLYLWDVRKLGEVLGGHVQAWKGLSRGIRVDSVERRIITASQDGVARVWTFV
ncbi:hypothetical protein, conserved [Trypanosoma brucei gambiense DAL972]|uniref:Uncharacterized protein n=1 Tax=Trypanosoma brucei gambiense (strain MHOM/CI/86/DAL972) TaxID=679716 RepID=D0A6A0_TRYB9|nr:hypothetical protein, conserved [Trypanosoma brucei gambiense DAL972]CBH17201.1 hypothetical protein, conserved [Trypanosoma brucei gambiense DAL972]|eukprot:XP_011779465.1 hypothetical protein, conserved [Trypanosoma brucei gambiense DAL972]